MMPMTPLPMTPLTDDAADTDEADDSGDAGAADIGAGADDGPERVSAYGSAPAPWASGASPAGSRMQQTTVPWEGTL